MKVSFFVSDHGYGHIMRNVPVMKRLTELGHEVVLICGEKHVAIATEYIGKKNIEYVEYHTDAGIYVKPGTLLLDKETTAEELHKYIAEFPQRIKYGKDIISKYHIDRVVVDIVPWALTASKEANIPSYLMANFTWIEQYEGYADENDINVLKKSFGDAQNILYYDLVNEQARQMLGNGTDVGFVARKFTNKVDIIRKEHSRPIVFLSLGGSNSGLDFDIDVSGLPYDFITTGALRIKGDNVTYLDGAVSNSQDYVKAADFCIAKAGWSTVSEMMLAGVRFAVISRPDVGEDTMTIKNLVNRKAAIEISVEDMRDMAAVMNRLEHYDKADRQYSNGCDKVVLEVIKDI